MPRWWRCAPKPKTNGKEQSTTPKLLARGERKGKQGQRRGPQERWWCGERGAHRTHEGGRRRGGHCFLRVGRHPVEGQMDGARFRRSSQPKDDERNEKAFHTRVGRIPLRHGDRHHVKKTTFFFLPPPPRRRLLRSFLFFQLYSHRLPGLRGSGSIPFFSPPPTTTTTAAAAAAAQGGPTGGGRRHPLWTTAIVEE